MTPMDRPALWMALAAVACAPLLAYFSSGAPEGAAVLIGAAALLALAWPRPHWFMYGMVAGMFLPMLGVKLTLVYVDIGDLCAVFVGGVWVLALITGRRRPRLVRAAWVAPLYLIWCAITCILGVAPQTAYGQLARLIMAGLAGLAIIDVANSERRIRACLWICLLLAAGHAVAGIATANVGERPGGLFDQPNSLGYYLGIGLFSGPGLQGEGDPRWRRVLVFALMGLIMVAIIATASRGAYLAVAAATIWYLRSSRRPVIAAGVIALIGVGALQFLGDDREDLIERRLMFRDVSVPNRVIVLDNATTAILKNPIFGVGYAQFDELRDAGEVVGQRGRSPHNLYASVAASTGLVGFVLFMITGCVVVVPLFRLGKKQARERPTGQSLLRLVSSLETVVVFMVASVLTKGGGRLAFWSIWGLCGAVVLLVRDERRQAARTVLSSEHAEITVVGQNRRSMAMAKTSTTRAW